MNCLWSLPRSKLAASKTCYRTTCRGCNTLRMIFFDSSLTTMALRVLEVCHIFYHWTNTLKMQHSREFQPGLHKTLAFCIGWTSSLLSNCISHLRRTISHWKLSPSKSANRLVLCYIQWMISQLMWRLLASIQIWSIPGLGNAQWECVWQQSQQKPLIQRLWLQEGVGQQLKQIWFVTCWFFPAPPTFLRSFRGQIQIWTSHTSVSRPFKADKTASPQGTVWRQQGIFSAMHASGCWSSDSGEPCWSYGGKALWRSWIETPWLQVPWQVTSWDQRWSEGSEVKLMGVTGTLKRVSGCGRMCHGVFELKSSGGKVGHACRRSESQSVHTWKFSFSLPSRPKDRPRPSNLLKDHHRIFHAYFVYPNEKGVRGSAVFLSALISRETQNRELVGGVSLYETSAAGELFNAVHFCLFIAYDSIQYHTMYCVYMTYSLSDVWSLLLPLVLLPLAICATTHLVRQFAWAEVDGYLQLRGTEEQRAHDGCFAAAGWVPNAVDHIHDRSSLTRSRALNGHLIDLSSIPNQYNFTSICQQDSARSCLWKDASLWISIPVLDSTSVHRMLSDTIIMLWTAESLYTWAMTSNLDFGYPCVWHTAGRVGGRGWATAPAWFRNDPITMGGGDPLPQCLSRTGQRVCPCLAMFGLAFENQPFHHSSPAICVFSHCGIPLGKGAKLCNIIRMPYATND